MASSLPATSQKEVVARTLALGKGRIEANAWPSVVGYPSPIECLPVELLAEIFVIFNSIGHYAPLINDSTVPPRALCRVCRRWKKIARGLPRLWTAVSVDLDVIGWEQREMLPHVLERWFSLANNLPLALKFTSTNNHDEKVNEIFNTCIIPFAPRLHHLDIHSLDFIWPTPTELQTPALPPAMTEDAPSDTPPWSTFQFPELESAIIRDTIEVFDELDSPLFPFAPRLQRLRMDDISFIGGTAVQLIVPWSQLTHLILVGLVECHVWLQLLPMCHNLQLGLFDIYEDIFEENPSTPQRMAFNHLIDLTVAFHVPVDPSILGHFDFPALETLRLQNDLHEVVDASDCRSDETFWTDSIRRRLCQQLAPLRRLSLHGSWPLTCLLEAVTHVVELDLYNTGMVEPVLSCLRRRPDGYLPAPSLKVLIVDIADCSELQTDVLADIIKPRRCVKPGVERFVVFAEGTFRTQMAVEVLTEQLRPFVEDGFIFELKNTRPSHWSGRLGSVAAEWHEGMFDIKE